MPTPFPGMDPYLEGRQLWRDVHARLIVAVGDALAPLRQVARQCGAGALFVEAGRDHECLPG